MEIKRKTLPVADANGWYLLQSESRYWIEDFVDEDTGDPVSIERSEILCKNGTLVNDIIQSLLQENGIEKVKVSNVQLLGTQDKSLNIWETVLSIRTGKGESKKSYVVYADSPTESELIISEYLEVNVDCTFRPIKVNQLDYGKVIRLYDQEVEDMLKNKKRVLWYKCVVYSMIDDEGDDEQHSAGKKNILVQSISLQRAIDAIKAVLSRSEFEAHYNTFKLMQELKIEDVFIPEDKVSYYSDEEL